MDFKGGRFWVFFGCFFVGGRGILSICWVAGDWEDCGYFKGWMGFMGRVGEWDSGGAEGRGGKEEEAREGEDDGDWDGER